MTQNEVTKLGYLETKKKTTVKPLTAETLEKLMTSEHVNKIMTLIEQEKDEDKQGMLKEQLPAVQFHCEMRDDCVRPDSTTATASGFSIHDWDHLPLDPAVVYFENISGREEELGVVFAHVTPRGKGLRLVTTMKPNEQPEQCQRRFAALFGMEKYADTKVKDLPRLSFLPWKKNVLFLNEKGLFEKPLSPTPLQPTPVNCSFHPRGGSKYSCDTDVNQKGANGQCTSNYQLKEMSEGQRETSGVAKCDGGSVADSFTYEGIKYSAIIEALLQRIATQGEPREGERNDDLFKLVRELRHVCDYDFSKVYMLVAPYFKTLPDSEIRRTISSAIATNGRTITPVMRGVLAELHNRGVDAVCEDDGMKEKKLPKVSNVEEMILSKYPKYLRNHVFKAMLPILGTYGTHVRFDFCDGRENSLSFMTAVVGKSGSGKAFAAHLYEQMTGRFREEDAEERQKADKYLAEYNKAGEGSEKPDDPRPRVRLYGDDITTSQLLEYLDNLNGEHGLQFTEEVARLSKAKRTVWGDNDDLYCKSFDNGLGGKESKSKQTRNIRLKIYLNTLFCGTPGAMHKFYDNPEGGLNNRIIYDMLPAVRIKGFPHYGNFSAQEQKMFDEAMDVLWQAGRDGKKIKLAWLEKAINQIKNKWDKDDEENPNEVWYDLGKRALVVAMRVGVQEWLLRGRSDDVKVQREIIKVVKWIAETMRQNVYAFSGQEYEKICEKDNEYHQRSTRCCTKSKQLFSLLPDEFSVQDVVALRVRNGDSANVRMVLSRWMADGMIRSDSRGHYRKVKVMVA